VLLLQVSTRDSGCGARLFDAARARQWLGSLTGMETTRDRYGRPAFRRTALAPGLVASVALLIGVALIETEPYIVIRFIVAILALIVLVFAVQARHWWWLPLMLAIAVLWNPVYPLDAPPLEVGGPLWLGAHYLAILVFVLAGVFIKVPYKADDARG
jgi:hypothetical protein